MSYAYSESSEEAELLANDRSARYSNHSSLVLYTLLPALHRRLSKLRSIREVLSYNSGRAQHSHSSSISDEAETRSTPPPSYTGNDREIGTLPAQPAIVRWMEHTTSPSVTSNRQSFSGSTTPTRVDEPGQEAVESSESGVQWRYADTGYASLLLAQSEVKRSTASQSFVRRQYISGVLCLLRGLPQELSSEEQQDLQDALPNTLRAARHTEQQLASRSNTSAGDDRPQPLRRQTILQQWVAMGTLYMFLTMAFVLPYFQRMIQEAYRLDRKHKLSDKLLAQGITTVAAMQRQTCTVAIHICAMNDGMVGEQLKKASMYMMQGVSGGLYDGLGEGMQVLGLRTGNEN